MNSLRIGTPLAMLSLFGALSAAGCGGGSSRSPEPDAARELPDASEPGEQDGSQSTEDAGAMDASQNTEDAGAMDASQDTDSRDAEVDAGDAAPQAPCEQTCDADFRNLVDCHGDIVSACSASEGCSALSVTCVDACQAAFDNKSSVGCDYYAVHMEQYVVGDCFAAFVANHGREPLHIGVEYAGVALDVSSFAAIPSGSGKELTYVDYDADAGLPPGEVAILFLVQREFANVKCPKAAAVTDSNFNGTKVGDAFHITTDLPAVAYQLGPYGGGNAGTTGGTLLFPTSAWDTNYLAVTAGPFAVAQPSMNIVAMADATTVTMLPVVAVEGGGTIPASPAYEPFSFTLDKGQHAQLTQKADLTGSVLSADKPVGFLAGQPCLQMPHGTSYCDHAEQMLPPLRALGSRYVGVMYRPRIPAETASYWRLIGTQPDTQLSWSSEVGGPATLQQGQSVVFQTGTPFVVESQDAEHPFMLFQYMSGSAALTGAAGYGDPEFMFSVPTQQYLSDYVFFTDPTYPETNLVMVRSKGKDGQFHDVTLDCLGVVPDWTQVGDDHAWARVDLSRNDFESVGECSNGAHEVSSDAPFGLWIWGWGSPNTTSFTSNTSYGYAAGMNLRELNQVVILPEP